MRGALFSPTPEAGAISNWLFWLLPGSFKHRKIAILPIFFLQTRGLSKIVVQPTNLDQTQTNPYILPLPAPLCTFGGG